MHLDLRESTLNITFSVLKYEDILAYLEGVEGRGRDTGRWGEELEYG
jgi:hypothetical protein